MEGVDQREEELMDEILVMDGISLRQRIHQRDKDITKLLLTRSFNAGALEIRDEVFCCFWGITHQQRCRAFYKIYYLNRTATL